MFLNYLLLAVTGIYSAIAIIRFKRGQGWISQYMFGDIFVILIFILVLIATIMGIDYITFRTMIESSV
jgi:hypothetical protein